MALFITLVLLIPTVACTRAALDKARQSPSRIVYELIALGIVAGWSIAALLALN